MKQVKNLEVYEEMLIVVDMVNGFVNEGVLHDKEIQKIIPRQLQLMKVAKGKNWLLVFVKDTHDEQAVEFKRFGGTKHCVRGTHEAILVPEILPYEQDGISIEKNSTSFFVAPGFQELINKMPKLKRIHVVGCCTDICDINGVIPMMNYFDQVNREVEVLVHEDAIETYGGVTHDRDTYSNAAKLLLKQQGAKLVKNF